MEISRDFLENNYKTLGEYDIEQIFSSKNPKEELEFILDVNKAITEKDVMSLRNKLDENYKQYIKNEIKNN